mgnify:CR=1 FL=1
MIRILLSTKLGELKWSQADLARATGIRPNTISELYHEYTDRINLEHLVWEIQPIDEYRLDIYEGYPRYYFKKNIMVDIGGRKKKAMVYIMDERQLPGKPSVGYIETIRQGYTDNNMDISIFEKSLEVNSIECA